VTIELLVPLLAIVGAVVGFAADRLSTRWPDHEEGYARRWLDWRTALLTLGGGLVFAALAVRWPDPGPLVILLGFSAALLVLLATDLDQRLLPDLITLPMIAVAALLLVAGWSPLLAGKEFALVSGVAAAIAAPAFLFVTDLLIKGDLGSGYLKLAVSLGLLAGILRLFVGFLIASVVFAGVLVLLLVVRRVSLRSAVPFGPVLIGATFVAMFLR